MALQAKQDEEAGAVEATQTVLVEEEDKVEEKTNDENGDKEKPQASMAEVFSFVTTTKVKLQIVGALLSAIVSGLVMPAMVWYFAAVFEKLGADPESPDFMEDLKTVAFSFMVLGVVAFLSNSIQTTLMETAAGEMTQEFKKQWFQALLRQDMAYYDIKDVSSQAPIISNNGRQYRKGVGRKLAGGVQFFVTCVGGVAYGFYSSWRTSLTILACVPFMTASVLLLVKLNSSATARKNESYVKAGSIVSMAVSSIRTILSLNAVQVIVDKFVAATEESYRGAVGHAHLLGFAHGSEMASMLLCYVPVVLYGSYLMYSAVRDTGCDPSGAVPGVDTCDPAGKDVFGSLMGITIAASVLPQVSVAIEAITGARVACDPAIMAINRKVGSSSTETDKSSSSSNPGKEGSPIRRGSTAPLPNYIIDSSSETGLKPSSVVGNIEFENVTFAYPTRRETNVFEEFTLHIEAGTTVALVGPSGSGKSTVVQLLERFYDIDEGKIKLDDNELTSLNVKWLRQQIALVNQEPTLFPMSIKDNIKVACPSATDQQVEEAAMVANAHDFIVKFPDGYDTEVGDRGAQLSGGQRQRVSIARAVLKQSSLLLLDEATSALDSESEKVVQEALEKLMKLGGRTTVVIAHRLSTIMNADVIAVVDGGRITESGKHAELLAKRGKYYELVESQKFKGEEKAGDEAEPSDAETNSTAPLSRISSFVDDEDDGGNAETPPVLRLRDVHFSYPARQQNWVFRGLNLTVKRGETLALVGPSGQGKSTVIQLFEAFYRPTKGSVEFLGVDMKDINVKWIRDQLGLVGQEPDMFDMTIAENIRFGCSDATQFEIEKASKQANAHDFISEFPDGYNTQMGEFGAQVSGGQRQRIALARALVRKPKVLLLDEATAALDSTSERIVQEALNKIMADSTQTTIVIAHRLSTIRNADRIAVIDQGKVREIGTHDELMAKPDGHYQRLQAMQSLVEASLKQSDKSKRAVGKSLISSTKEEDASPKEKLDDIEIDASKAKAITSRARLLGQEDWPFYIIGGIGAIMAGFFFPAYGIVFADMIEVLYFPVLPCNATADECSAYWDDVSDKMKDDSFNVFYQIVGLIAITLLGNVLLFYGFGTATEKMNKRVRDAAFESLVRQEVSWFDVRSEGTIVSQLAEDAALIHAFAGEPIRTMSLSISSVMVGLIISFVYMWPFALIALGILPFMSFGAEAEMVMYLGEDEGDAQEDHKHSSSQIAIESISNIRTVAALTLEEEKLSEYSGALAAEEPTPIRSNFVKGCSSGLGQFIQMWGMALMFWWGGWLLANYGDNFTYRDYLVSMFAMLFSLYGLALAAEGMTDKDKAKQAAARIFDLIDRESLIDPLSEEGKKDL